MTDFPNIEIFPKMVNFSHRARVRALNFGNGRSILAQAVQVPKAHTMKHIEREACENASPPAVVCARALVYRISQGRFPAGRARGFSLIELMVVVAIVAVMLMIALPSFRTVTVSNRISSEVNTFVGDLQYTRSEALRRGATVSMCPSSNGSDCLANSNWHLGWIVFNDPDNSGTRTGTEAVLRRQLAFIGTDVMVSIPVATRRVTYNRDGFNNMDAILTLAVRSAPVNNANTRCVAINAVGRHTIQKRGEGTCT
jgi:type IV fimbrial biogenesis protein FimT